MSATYRIGGAVIVRTALGWRTAEAPKEITFEYDEHDRGWVTKVSGEFRFTARTLDKAVARLRKEGVEL